MPERSGRSGRTFRVRSATKTGIGVPATRTALPGLDGSGGSGGRSVRRYVGKTGDDGCANGSADPGTDIPGTVGDRQSQRVQESRSLGQICNERTWQMRKKTQIIVSFSGGKDSTWMLLEMLRRGEQVDEVVFFDTGWEFPQMLHHVNKIKQLVESRNIKFTTLHPRKPFDFFMFDTPHKSGTKCGWSWCGYGGGRWGTREKISTLKKYFKTKKNYVQCIGIAADEPDRVNKEQHKTKRFPLVEWGITEAECLSGCYSLGYDWGGLYEDLDRVSCKFCALKNLNELRNMYKKMPDVWNELRDYQSRTRLPYKGKGKSVFDLEKRFELENEFESAGKSIRGKEFYTELKRRILS